MQPNDVKALLEARIENVDFHIQGWHYPAFNVADSAIVLGAILMGIDMLRPRRH